MAVRSGAGTGVVVSLVVFILTTFFLLVLTIVFYTKQTKAAEAQAEAEQTLDTYIRRAERTSEVYKNFEDAAQQRNESVTKYLHGTMQSVMQFVDGAPNTTVDQLKTNFARLGVGETDIVRTQMQDTARALRDHNNEVDRLNRQLEAWDQDNAQLKAQIDELKKSHLSQLDEMQRQISEYRDAAVAYRQEVDQVKNDMNQRVDRLLQRYEQEKLDLQNENDQLSEERVVLITRIEDLEAKVRQNRIGAQDPSRLVDGRVIDHADANDQVFIDRGRVHHIVRGMTFEVYDDEAALAQVDRITGEVPRGKASIEVLKVGETTSTCKIVRNVPGRPVVRNDVVANAVYDPQYVFKFMIHGKFDLDRDARPTEGEAEYLRSLVIDWGGQVVTGETLPGDLDFLVLGEEPPLPPPLADDATPIQTEIWLRKRQAYERYNQMFQQARDAQIPILNANRFFILTGYTPR